MISRTSLQTFLPLLALALVTVGNVGVRAADDKEKKPDRPPLKLQVNDKPLKRDSFGVSYAPLLQKVAPSVVSVFSTRKAPAQDLSALLNDPQLRRFFEGPGGLGPLPPSQNRPGQGGGRNNNKGGRGRSPDQQQQGLGSGVIITTDGYILTNNHVVEDADEVKVSFGDPRREYPANIVGRDAKTDIAVLKIEAPNLKPALMADSEQLQVGDVVLAIGNPFGLGQAVSRGIVSALGRGGLGLEFYEDFIQTDAAINPGNSGGALVDTEGRVVGVNTAILSGSGGFAGIGFAIPINLVRSVAEQIVNTGRVDRGFLGVKTQEIDQELSSQFKTDRGALITEISDGSPADKAGLKPGDVITKLNNTTIRDPRHLALTASQLLPDSEVTIGYIRDGTPARLTTKLGRQPSDSSIAGDRGESAAKDIGILNGVTVGEITPELREQFKVPVSVKGAIITDVEPTSPSGRQGLRPGDVILELDRRAVKDVEEAVRLSEELKGPKTMILLWREGQPRFLVIDETKK